MFVFPDDAVWDEAREAVTFSVELGEYRGTCVVPRRVLHDLIGQRPTPEDCVQHFHLQRTQFERIVEDPRVLALCDRFLLPGYLLTASQAICIYPGETPQPVHSDDSFYTIPRPRPALSFSTIVAVDAFTADNGATEIIPGSIRDIDDEPGSPREKRCAGDTASGGIQAQSRGQCSRDDEEVVGRHSTRR